MTTARSAPRVFIAHAAYAVCVHLACLVAFVPFLVRVLRNRAYGGWMWQRLKPPTLDLAEEAPIWVHAVSVGEVKASRPLIQALRQQHPEIPLVLSTGTVTGCATARQEFPGLPVFAAPLDLPLVVNRCVRRVNPRLLILMELEVWPAFLRCIDRRGTPQVIVNGRLSASSFKGYRRLSWWLPEFDRIDLVAAQDETYAQRIASLGVPPERIHVTGNQKHDLLETGQPVPPTAGTMGATPSPSFGRELGLVDGLPVFVAGSTHEGEDEPALEAWLASGGGEAAHMVLVPRHLDRLKDITRILKRHQQDFVLRSMATPDRPSVCVLLVDTMGELESFFDLADVVFLGGSLTPVGGHNVLEPAVAGCPVLVGPYLETCRREADLLAAGGGLAVVQTTGELAEALSRLLGNPVARKAMGVAAKQAAHGLQGATQANLSLLRQHGFLPEHPSPRA